MFVSCYTGAMDIWLEIVSFLFGLIVGSFLNVVIYRYNTGAGGWRIYNGRSRCLACNRSLRWFELIPVFSYIWQGGRCGRCGSAISAQYPLVELATGFLFVAIVGQSVTWLAAALAAIIWSLLVVITVYDLRHQIIPDGLVYAASVAAALLAASEGRLPSALLAALGLAAFFAALWYFSGGRWMGFGDAKLALTVGLLLGPTRGISAMVLAFWLGAVVGLLLIILSRFAGRSRSYTMKSELPFAPFIILGTALTFFAEINVFTLF